MADYISSFTGAQIDAAVDAVLNGDSVTGELIPDYWQSHLDARVADIRTAMAAAGWNKSAFLWYTDVHWTHGYQMAPPLLRYLYKHTPINKVNFGGDIVNAEGAVASSLDYLWDWRLGIRGLDHHSVAGNHDDGNEIDNRWTDADIYTFLLAAEETPDVVRGGALYYYIDYPAEQTRYLYLDTATKDGNIYYDPEQQSWLKQTLLSTPGGWHIVAFSHIWMNVDYTVTPPVVSSVSYGGQFCLDMFDAYNARTGDFASCTGKVEFCMGGHCHVDADYASAGGIPVILTETDSRHVRSGLSCTQGTTTESAVNAIIADYTAGVVNVIRIGRGNSRTVQLDGSGSTVIPDDETGDDSGSTETESDYDLIAPTGNFTNVLKTSVDASGAPYNSGHGYKNDTRINSSDAETTATGWDVTGYIAVSPGATLRLHNLEFVDTQNVGGEWKRSAIFLYDSNKGTIKNTGGSNASLSFYLGETPDSKIGAVTDNVTGDFIQLTIPASWYTTLGYIRIVAKNIRGDSIITVNEEINITG